MEPHNRYDDGCPKYGMETAGWEEKEELDADGEEGFLGLGLGGSGMAKDCPWMDVHADI